MLQTVVLLGLGIVTISMVRGEVGVFHVFDLGSSEKMLMQRISQLKEEIDRNREEVKKIENSPIYAQKVLKDRYHTTEPGERIYYDATN